MLGKALPHHACFLEVDICLKAFSGSAIAFKPFQQYQTLQAGVGGTEQQAKR